MSIPLWLLYRPLMQQYTSETAVLSYTQRNHSAYQALLSLGRVIVPMLIADMRREDIPHHDFSFWGATSLLYELVGDESPKLPEKHRGKYEQIRKMWLKWADERSF